MTQTSSQTHKLYRVNDGEATNVPDAQSAVVTGQWDQSNWGTDWMLFSARTVTEALALAAKYDRRLNDGRIARPKYLRSLSHGAHCLR